MSLTLWLLGNAYTLPGVVAIVTGGLLLWLILTLGKHNKDTIKVPDVDVTIATNDAVKNTEDAGEDELRLKVFYGTQTGTAKNFSEELQKDVSQSFPEVHTEVINLKDFDPEDGFPEENLANLICVFIISTYTDGVPPEGATWFCKWLTETADDFRVQKTLFQGLRFGVVALGNSLYKGNYNKIGKEVDRCLHQLSAKRITHVGLIDENVSESKHGGKEADFASWKSHFLDVLAEGTFPPLKDHACECKQNGGKCSNKKTKENQFESSSDESDAEPIDGATEGVKQSNGLVDLEDLGKVVSSMKKAKVRRQQEDEDKENNEPREMVTPLLRQSLEKQGYRLIGSHSGVKLCRWTKSMLRGRGGCYKHTFYGIESHRCMETTPSLACANKCVFCWRHHTNPVGTEWRWKMNPAEEIFEGAIKNHTNLIKQFKGVPGVQPERFQEGLKPIHCALSLVGEPIMYPEINKFVTMLHNDGISSFLVTNAQFPEAIRDLVPVTQLYVSVDASTKESLKKIDRPLFKDFWQRFLDSLKELGDKGQRTVYRLTLVKSFNTTELDNYSELVKLGRPDFIEVKGVTYCGESKASSLTMENVPWHEEVVNFVKQLTDRLPDYEIAAEHEHSNCVLISHKKFKVDGVWHTWIDYPKFHKINNLYTDSKGAEKFTAVDYMAPTPHWAVYGAREQGFDPQETRFHRKKKKDLSGC
ncbi:unnamed protein product [Owenia fusiformis]|uniref:S-adenosyl-L-methionine-dependent tRNA 4-demethylwyosine synthase TYW1 n=1 Tax=Owenia fusiformis TaxID=6347 RepID=A0A8J1TK49_OWEFU|nr:unnamed protein product [Owenia fusiformis]